VLFKVEKNTPNSLKIQHITELLSESWYRIIYNSTSIESIFGDKLKDSTYKWDFSTSDWRTFPNVSGKLLDKYNCGNVYLRLVSAEKQQNYEIKVEESGNWKFTKVKPGKYKLETYCDSNGNGKYDVGTAFPFKHAEKFKNFSNEIDVKDRWDVENIMLLFDE
jgi:hypothetical protein